MHGPVIQIAGVHDVEEALAIAAAGATHLGLPLRLPVHREDCTDEEAAAIVRALPAGVGAVLITYLDRAADIAALAARLGTPTVQLHGDLEPAEAARLRVLAPGLEVWKSLVVAPGNADALERDVAAFAPVVDGFLTDTWDPATGARGATGRTHDWEVSRRLVALSPHPVVLAGGLTPANVAAAVRHVRPAGVDAHTGVEGPDGRKDPARVAAFVAQARTAFGPGDDRGGT